MRFIGKFEWKIILALLVTAAAPLLFTMLMVDRLVEESMSVGLNDRVLRGLRDGVDLYKEVIESRLRVVRLQGQALSGDPKLRRALAAGQTDKVEHALQELLDTNAGVSQARILAGETAMIGVDRSSKFAEGDWKFRSDRWEIEGGHQLEVTFGIGKSFLQASEALRELVMTLESVKSNFQPWKMGYYRLFLFIYVWILVAAVALGVILSRSVTKRVARLFAATREAARGNLTVRVVVKGQDEIGSLSASFNQMLDEIQRGRDRIVYLEKVSSWQEIARRLAHEIKNPLTPIQLAMQELHRSYRGDDPKFLTKLNDSAEIVEEEVATLRRMVETFSEFAKMPDVQPAPVELGGFVSDFIKHNPHVSDRLEYRAHPGEVMVLLDKTLMGRVLMNLVVNGLEASPPESKVQIAVGLGDGWGTLQVLDFGSGLSGQARAQIFQPYFTTKTHGTGLGLAIVKKIVLQHGGEISVADGEKAGTVFTVRLRLEEHNTHAAT